MQYRLRTLLLIVWAVLLPTLYVISYGPAVWMVSRQYAPTQILFLYRPLYAVSEYVPIIDDFMIWQFRLALKVPESDDMPPSP